jgi:hypothetical protein
VAGGDAGPTPVTVRDSVRSEAGAPVRSQEVCGLAKEMGVQPVGGAPGAASELLGGVVVDTQPTRSPRNRWRLVEDDPHPNSPPQGGRERDFSTCSLAYGFWYPGAGGVG